MNKTTPEPTSTASKTSPISTTRQEGNYSDQCLVKETYQRQVAVAVKEDSVIIADALITAATKQTTRPSLMPLVSF